MHFPLLRIHGLFQALHLRLLSLQLPRESDNRRCRCDTGALARLSGSAFCRRGLRSTGLRSWARFCLRSCAAIAVVRRAIPVRSGSASRWFAEGRRAAPLGGVGVAGCSWGWSRARCGRLSRGGCVRMSTGLLRVTTPYVLAFARGCDGVSWRFTSSDGEGLTTGIVTFPHFCSHRTTRL